MKIKPIYKSSDASEIAAVRNLYEEAFPREERIDWNDLMRLAIVMPLSIDAYYIDDKFIGFTILNERNDFNWFWYFAVIPSLRGNGYGQRILDSMLQRYAHSPLILDVESPFQECTNFEQRQRRYNFYLRNGFKDSHVGRTFEGITYCILIYGNYNFTIKDYDRILSHLRHHWDTMPESD